MPVMRAVATTRESPIGVAAPARPVPLPRGTIGRSWVTAARTHACTCSVVVGRATSAHPPSTIDASRAYSRRASGSERTASGPSAASSSRRAASTSAMSAGYRSTVGAWAELEVGDPELAAFGRERFEGKVVFHATLRRDGGPRLHPVSPWFGAGLLLVGFRARSPKNDEVALDGRYAMHSAIEPDNHEGEGGEFLVRGWMERISLDHPGAVAVPYEAEYELAIYACSVEEAVGTTYPGGGSPLYRRWKG